ncbi:MAG TPA: VWA domain-containing protein [Terriglobales bacterium]|nr:VWA domain-containing protein [Terriglobales bacterium]
MALALLRTGFTALLLITVSAGQTTQPANSAQNNLPEPGVTLRANTRMVTIEVVARDRHGNSVPGLTAEDFQVFEQTTGRKKEKSEQKIAECQPVAIRQLIAQDQDRLNLPAGVYSNLLSLHEHPVPPTILLVDGINTELSAQLQVHAQMIRMLKSLPKDVPVAVFILGRRLSLVQGFTTDPSLLKAALEKASSTQPSLVQMDPRDVPDSLSAVEENVIANDPNMAASPVQQLFLEAIERFEKETYASNIDMRVDITVDALLSLAHNISGYPGRKNLLWLSSSFPVVLAPEMNISGVAQSAQSITMAPSFRNPDTNSFFEMRNYGEQMREVAAALSQAKLAIYPIDMGGVKTEAFFDADTRTRSKTADTGATASREMNAIDHEAEMNADRHEAMYSLASETGGRVCLEDNDLGDCIQRAMNDSSSFYEISYYPTSTDWNGEFRKIIVKSKRAGLHLAYREGYFARPDDSADPKSAQASLRQAGCDDYLNATSILLMGQTLPSDSSQTLKYFLAIDAAGLTFAPQANGGRTVDAEIAVCSFDKAGEPSKLMMEPFHAELSGKEYAAVLAMRGLRHTITIPDPKAAAVRLLVRDNPSGRLGSITIPVEERIAAAPAGTSTKSAQQ